MAFSIFGVIRMMLNLLLVTVCVQLLSLTFNFHVSNTKFSGFLSYFTILFQLVFDNGKFTLYYDSNCRRACLKMYHVLLVFLII